jgi:hypothetical protein
MPAAGTARRAAVSDHLPGHITPHNTLFRTLPPVSVDTGCSCTERRECVHLR